ncbi:MAG: DNA gyrase subunit A [Planctomycetota bacterium]
MAAHDQAGASAGDPTPPTGDSSGGSGERILDLDIASELKQSYLRYAMSVIVDRALPDVRDGLKPSQRRILVAMNDLNLGPNRKTIKCAKVVGETMGNYHPHGDQAIYPTLVRMAQPFNMGERLVEGQGNFGSIDRDPPASMRYTECRMTHAAVEMLDDLDKETVDFRPTYDEARMEPVVLPGRFPNLLINGGAGIAVAMASSIPPHNPGEVADAILAYLDNPEIDIPSLMQILPGPDLPTGARICGRAAILEAYTTGRAALEMRAVCHVQEGEGRRGPQIVVTEIPYQVNKAALVQKIADLAKSDRVDGITDVRDESGKDIRVVISLRRDVDPDIVLNQLYKYSQLRETLSVIMIALVDGRPELCSVKRLIETYVAHRREVITRRTRYLLRKAEERDHIVAGLLRALDLIDEIVALVRASSDPKEAKAGLIERFGFSTLQADAILQMRLQRLTGLQRQELEAEHADLVAKIADYRDILARDERVVAILREDMAALKARFPVARRTRIEDSQDDYTSLDLITPENVVITLSHEGYIKRTGLDAYRRQRRGGKGIKGTESKEGDFVEHLLVANTHDTMLYFTDTGRVFRDGVYVLPDLGRYTKGRAIVNLLELGPEERIRTVLPVTAMDDDRYLLFATRNGLVKRTALSDFANIHRGGIIAIQLVEGDALIGVALVDPADEVLLVTARGMAIRFAVSDARAMGRATRGVRGIKLHDDDRVVDMSVARNDEIVTAPDGTEAALPGTLLTVFERGQAKRTPFAEYGLQGRGGQGLRNVSRDGLERNGEVVAARSVLDGDEVILITQGGKSIRMRITSEQLRPMSRSTAGVRAIEVPDGDRVVSMAWVRPEDDGEDDAEGNDDAEGGDGEASNGEGSASDEA